MKIVICWSQYSGYFAACCRELAKQPDVELKVFCNKPSVPFADNVMDGVDCHCWLPDEKSPEKVAQAVRNEKPDVVILCGWGIPAYRKLLWNPAFTGVKFLMTADTSWIASWRQLLARFVLRRIVRRVDAFIITGERGRIFARYIGFPKEKIFTTTYGCDYPSFTPALPQRLQKSWPKSFVYIGRYVPVKGLNVMLEAYQLYRKSCRDPWPLHCFGSGELKAMLANAEGVVDHGFSQPGELGEHLAQHGVFVLPSFHEPWGVVIAEAAAAGLPVICSSACTAGADMIRHLFNGLIFPTGNAERLAQCFLWCHQHYDELPAMGKDAQFSAKAYSAENWAKRMIWTINNSKR